MISGVEGFELVASQAIWPILDDGSEGRRSSLETEIFHN